MKQAPAFKALSLVFNLLIVAFLATSIEAATTKKRTAESRPKHLTGEEAVIAEKEKVLLGVIGDLQKTVFKVRESKKSLLQDIKAYTSRKSALESEMAVMMNIDKSKAEAMKAEVADIASKTRGTNQLIQARDKEIAALNEKTYAAIKALTEVQMTKDIYSVLRSPSAVNFRTVSSEEVIQAIMAAETKISEAAGKAKPSVTAATRPAQAPATARPQSDAISVKESSTTASFKSDEKIDETLRIMGIIEKNSEKTTSKEFGPFVIAKDKDQLIIGVTQKYKNAFENKHKSKITKEITVGEYTYYVGKFY